MTELFTKILNMSLSASALVFIVLFLRPILRKTPKWINVLLWGMVALRLVCPFSIESDFSQVPKSVSTGQALSQWTDDYVGGVTIIHDSSTQYEAAIEAGRTPIPAGEEGTYVVTAPDQVSAPKTIGNTVIPVLSVFWLLGIIAMLQYTFLSYDRLRSRVRGAVLFQDNISLSEAVSTPFVLGIFRPWIYLPVDIPEPDICHVIAHERMHIQRKDHWWKPLGFLLLCIHWFNPLIWLAYTLFCRDIELACDERAVKNMNPGQRANYSQALLNCSVRQRPIYACPLTFGEVGVKDRVKNVLSYKKPAVWLIGIALLLCLTVALCFLTDPKTSDQLKWLQDLTTANVDYIEYRCFDAPLDSQYHLYQGSGLPEAVEVLKSFDGEPCDPIDPQSLLGGSYTLNIVQKNGQIHTVTNYGNKYLSIDNSFFEDTCGILNQIWDYYFAGTTYLPSAENTGLGVSLTIEAVSALKADEVRCDALFPESGSRYTFYKDQDVELVSILNSLTPEDFLPTTGISAKTTVFISHKDYLISLYYDGEAVQLAVTDSTGTNNAWAVQNAQLNNFLDRISLNSPSNSNDKIYDLAPLTSLSPYYTVEQAAIDKVVTMVDGDIRYNAHIWKDFLSATESEQPATVRILKYYHEADGNEAVRAIYDLEYDGTQYILHGARDGMPYTRTFQHLRREHVAIYPIQRDYDEYECYYLTNSRIITLKNLDDDRFTDPAKADQYTPIIVYSDLIAYPAHPEIPTNLTYATLDWEGNTVATVSDSDTLEKLYTLLSNAEEQTSGERPYAPGLSLILYPASGEVVTLKLDTASDLVRVGSSAFYDYGPGTDARRELFTLLGLNVTRSGDFSQELYGLMGPLPGGRSLEALERESGRLRQLLEWENGA